MKDPKTDIETSFMHDGAPISTTSNGTSFDMVRHNFMVITLNASLVAAAVCNVQLQDSADNVSFSNVAGLDFDVPVLSAGSHSGFVFVRARDVRRYVRLQFTPGGTTRIAALVVAMNSTHPKNPRVFDIDTTPA